MRAPKTYFDPVIFTHDDAVRRLLAAREKVSLKQITDAFVASLSTRRLELRSALGSYAFAANFPDHGLASSPSYKAPTGNLICEICGNFSGPGDTPVEHDLNVLSYERFKWGGVRHRDPLYAWFDLDQFAANERPSPTREDCAEDCIIIDVAQTMPADSRANDLKQAVSKLFPSNDSERRILVECLAMCGVLAPASRPGFLEAFPSAARRNADRPSDHRNDWGYPAIWWRGADGVNSKALALCFPEIHRPADNRPA